MSDPVLFAFVDPAMQIIAICAAAFILLFFLSTLSDAVRVRTLARRTGDHERIAVSSSP
ncbi:hypothetical protein [Solimonas terrae]|uniref:Uncharacterized protein n=1 Tax=Solimonas terrae TaxID=1396819 RepID=A0A6M2BLT8_9GAMM|nr:hypothetical protein [Solimonas terrae]NGY03418.1 hypothetical protein [Solimonas terrae]